MTDPASIVESQAAENIRQQVREGYGRIARGGASPAEHASQPSGETGASGCGCGAGGCCGGNSATHAGSADAVARSVGYGDKELAHVPDGANLGLSCGNPTAIASLKPGEVVLDLGSGGGFDVFIAGQKVGPSGRAIGVDMTADMIAKARRNAVTYRQQTGLDNVEFRLGEIEHLPMPDRSVDVVISNCVINLSPHKPAVYREIARVLKPGGRVAISDLALLRPLPLEIREMIEALVGCIAGAALIDDTRAALQSAGLADIRLTPKPEYVKAMSEWQDPLYQKIAAHLPAGASAADYITSLNIEARRPPAGETRTDAPACCADTCCGG